MNILLSALLLIAITIFNDDDKMLSVGQPAPEFKGLSTDGGYISPSDYRGKWLLIFFYPKAFTSG